MCLYVLSVYSCYTFYLNVFPISYMCKHVSDTCKTRKYILQIHVDTDKHKILKLIYEKKPMSCCCIMYKIIRYKLHSL